jgi:predicted MFS family arabinose efflux permease
MGMLRRGFTLLFKRRDFGLLMAVQFAAQAGDGIVQSALAKLVAFGGQKGFDLEDAKSPDELLRMVLYIFVPYTIISPFIGVIIDRWDRRRLLFVANGLRAVVVLLIALVGTGRVGEVGLFLAFFLTLASTRVILATKSAALPATLEQDSLVEANAVSQLGGALFQLGGAGAALIVADSISVRPIVLVGAIVYGAGALVALRIRRAGGDTVKTSFFSELAKVAGNIAAGVREVARKKQAALAISTYFWLRLLWSFSIVAIGLEARELLAGKDMLILIVTGGAGAAGAALGFLLAGKLHARFPTTGHLVLAASAVGGGAVALFGAIDMKVALAALTFFLGFGFFLGKISLDTLVQEALGDDFRGRAFSLYDIAYNLAWVVAATVLKIAWTEDNQGLLIAGMGVVFLLGVAALAGWFRGAGLLRAPSNEARAEA